MGELSRTELSPLAESPDGDRDMAAGRGGVLPLDREPPRVDLRQACVNALGESVFISVDEYPKVYGSESTDYDSQMRQDLTKLMGESNLKFWPLIDMYIFGEELEI